jgi:hypothetical protein
MDSVVIANGIGHRFWTHLFSAVFDQEISPSLTLHKGRELKVLSLKEDIWLFKLLAFRLRSTA